MSKPIDMSGERAPAARTMRQQYRAAVTKAKILNESAKVFDAIGYSATSINDVIGTSDLTKGSVFYHFRSKESIAQHLVHDWSSAAEAVFAEAGTAAELPAEQLRSVFLNLAHRVENDLLLRVGMKLTIEPAVEGAHQAYRELVDATAGVVNAGIAHGSIADTARSRRLAWNLCAGLTGAVNVAPVSREGIDFLASIDDLIAAHLGLVVER
ncbi:hypothetical protein AN948_05135 [Rhodococcus sp. ADH]|uniref:TetR/AcrR family transcriptional regulator n=1 Tax=Nocardiaceae TaxID=85025 RepID=UPI0006CCECDB|nr:MULTISPECIES: TetR/AcrR family transcriptional regulator [Rhodococcus]KPH20749.1 hypothetical protein AN948_05135 [Rhodococcus sp. ADH]